VQCNADYTISGNALRHWDVQQNSFLICNSRTITLTGTPAFSQRFGSATTGSLLNTTVVTFSGAATGKRYNVDLNAVISTAGGGASYYPGDAAGSAATGGQYA
jgi:hypothetical protein